MTRFADEVNHYEIFVLVSQLLNMFAHNLGIEGMILMNGEASKGGK